MTVKDNEVHGNSTYREVYNSIAFNLCKLGAQDKDLATSFKVCTDTIHNWKIAYKDFFESIKDGKRFYDTGLIESALVKKAVGYEFTEVKEEDGPQGLKTTKTIKHYAGDTGAMALYLKNRAPKEWKDKIEHTHIDKGSLSDLVDSASDD